MIDVVDPSHSYSVAEFRDAARGAMEASPRPLLIVGGSGLHFRSLVDPLDFGPTDPAVRTELDGVSAVVLREELLASDSAAGDLVDLANPRRVARAVEILRITGDTPTKRWSSERAAAVRAYRSEVPVVAVGFDPGDALASRVRTRMDGMIEAGLVEETAGLMASWGDTASRAVGYPEMAKVVAGEWDLATARRRAVDATTALARRQRTYFRRDPRIEWLGWDDDPQRRAGMALARFEEAGWTS
jgi:tRNA dimethylallyltransferase